MIIYAKSAFKHGITRQQMEDILRSSYSEIFDEGFDKTGHYSAMYVGFDSQGKLIEVKVKFTQSKIFNSYQKHVFHADKATKEYQKLFNQRKGNER